jgi:hypothetical protein
MTSPRRSERSGVKTLSELLPLSRTPEGLEEIRVMVAEYNGWINRGTWYERRNGDGTRFGSESLPPLTLDAMHELEKWLTDEEYEHFHFWLSHATPLGKMCSAPAHMRAVAFILTRQETKGAELERRIGR